MTLIFALFVLIGFIAMFLSTWPVSPYAVRIAWGSWLIAAILWAVTTLGLH